jgi:hypothetical protein
VGTLKLLGLLLAAAALAGCGGDSSPTQLVDGSEAAELPVELDGLDDAVLTRSAVKDDLDFEEDVLRACGILFDSGPRAVVERTGVRGSSLTMRSGWLLYGCDEILEPQTAQDPDRPYGGIWCSAARGRLDEGKLNDPRLSLCQNTSGDLTAFVWVEPDSNAKWVVVSDNGQQEVYEVTTGLPVRVTTTENIDPAGRASFDIEEYAADGTKLKDYVLEAAVAG